VVVERADGIGVHGRVVVYEQSATFILSHSVSRLYSLMLVWHKATTVSTAHFFLLENL